MRARQCDVERRAFPAFAVDVDASAVRCDDLADDPETETEAGEVLLADRAFEATEDALVILRRDPDAFVADLDV